MSEEKKFSNYDWGNNKINKDEKKIKKEKKEGLFWPTIYYSTVNKPLITTSAYLTLGLVGATVHSVATNAPPIVTKRLGNVAFLGKLSILYLVTIYYK
eukprot:gene7514-11838_t